MYDNYLYHVSISTTGAKGAEGFIRPTIGTNLQMIFWSSFKYWEMDYTWNGTFSMQQANNSLIMRIQGEYSMTK